MAKITVVLDRGNIEAASAALNILSLFDLKDDTSYPFLDESNWRGRGWLSKQYEFKCGNKSVTAPEDTFKAFMVVAEKMKPQEMGYAVAHTLKRVLRDLKEKKEPLGILPTSSGSIIYMGGPHDVAAESMVYWEVALQTIVLLVQYKSIEVMEPLDKGHHVYLQPPMT